MPNPVRRLLACVALAIVGYFVVSLVATLAQLANAAELALPGAGRPVFWGLTAVFAALLAAPLILWRRLPAPLQPPAAGDPAALAAYRAALLARLGAARQAAERLLVIEPAATDAGAAAVLAALRPVDWVVQADPIGCATLLLQLRPDALGCDAATAASLPAGLKSALLPGEGVR